MPYRKRRRGSATPSSSSAPRRRGRPPAAAADPCRIDFRATEDDAWYGVSLRVEEADDGEVYLRVMYCGFPEQWDERFPARSFRTVEELEDFRRRFRQTSVQLQDSECNRVIEGVTVCASSAFGNGEIKFYDAVVESVCYSDHKIVDGEEVCTCIFALFWQHGPNGGSTTSATIEHICLLHDLSGQLDPALDLYLELARKKVELVQQVSSGNLEVKIESGHQGSDKTNQKMTEHHTTGSMYETPTKSMNKSSEGTRCKHGKEIGHEMDLGGCYLPMPYSDSKESYYFIWVENLEKDTPPDVIVDFLYRQTSVLPQALVFPSLWSASYVRSAIFVDAREKTVKLSEFLHNPRHIIMSLNGRPWVITETKWYHGSLGGLTSKVTSQSPLESNSLVNKIKVVYEGTKEFEKGRQLCMLFLEFHEHVQGLHKRLVMEERKILLSKA